MKKFLWTVAWILVALWSALVYFVRSLFNAGGKYVAENVDQVGGRPEDIEALNEWARLAVSVGGWMIIAIWILGAVFVLGIAKLISMLIDTANGKDTVAPPRDITPST